MKTAVLGGTFDPVHRGHIRMAQHAIEEFELDKLVILPNGNPPHKAGSVTTDYYHRYNMLNLAFEGMDKVEISGYEADGSKYRYSVDTMSYFRKQYGEDTFMIIGADSLLTINQWYKYEKLLKENAFIVFHRQGDDNLQETADRYRELYNTKILISHMSYEDVSSTDIRGDIGGIWKTALTPKVRDYIFENGLYTGHEDITQHLKKTLKKSRFMHTMAVAYTARHLADLYGADRDKAYLAGLLHDCAKCLTAEELAEKIKAYSIDLDKDAMDSPQIWHSYVGAFEARKLCDIDDEVFDAIYYHTTGKAQMSKLCAIVYLADAIEPLRDYPAVEQLRQTAETSLDEAIKEYTKMSVEFIRARGYTVHPDTLAILNRR